MSPEASPSPPPSEPPESGRAEAPRADSAAEEQRRQKRNMTIPSDPPPTPPPALAVGDLVNVEARTWPGINKPGGVGKVVRLDTGGGSIDVRYLLGGSERGVELQYVRRHEDLCRGGRSRPKREVMNLAAEPPKKKVAKRAVPSAARRGKEEAAEDGRRGAKRKGTGANMSAKKQQQQRKKAAAAAAAATKEDAAGAAGMPKITDWIKKAAAKPRPTASAARSAPAAPRPADRAPAGTASGTSTAVAAGPGRGLRDVPAPGGVKKGGVKKATKKSAPNPYGPPPPERKAAPTGGPKVVRSATAAPPAAELAKGGRRPTEVAASGPQASRHFQARKSLKNLGSRHNRALGSSSSRADAKGATVLQRLHASNHRAATMFVEGIVGGEGRSGGAPCATSPVGPSGGDGQASQGHSPASLSMDTE